MFNSQYRFTVKKSSDKIKLLLCIKEEKTYKQALRGLFTPGTSEALRRETKEKVGGRTRIEIPDHHWNCPLQPCGAQTAK